MEDMALELEEQRLHDAKQARLEKELHDRPKQFADNIAANNWNWDIWEFARRCKLGDPGNGVDGKHTERQFDLFRQLNNTLTAIDSNVLTVIGSKQSPEEAAMQ